MAGGQEERVLKLRRAITAGGNLRPQAIGRLCTWLRGGGYATGRRQPTRLLPDPSLIPRWFRRDTRSAGPAEKRARSTPQAVLHSLALDFAVNLPIVTVSCAISLSLFFGRG